MPTNQTKSQPKNAIAKIASMLTIVAFLILATFTIDAYAKPSEEDSLNAEVARLSVMPEEEIEALEDSAIEAFPYRQSKLPISQPLC